MRPSVSVHVYVCVCERLTIVGRQSADSIWPGLVVLLVVLQAAFLYALFLMVSAMPGGNLHTRTRAHIQTLSYLCMAYKINDLTKKSANPNPALTFSISHAAIRRIKSERAMSVMSLLIEQEKVRKKETE